MLQTYICVVVLIGEQLFCVAGPFGATISKSVMVVARVTRDTQLDRKLSMLIHHLHVPYSPQSTGILQALASHTDTPMHSHTSERAKQFLWIVTAQVVTV